MKDPESIDEWIEQRPPRVRDVARRWRPYTCVRSKENRGHYQIYSYGEQEDGSVTLTLLHGHDSYGAGTAILSEFHLSAESIKLH